MCWKICALNLKAFKWMFYLHHQFGTNQYFFKWICVEIFAFNAVFIEFLSKNKLELFKYINLTSVRPVCLQCGCDTQHVTCDRYERHFSNMCSARAYICGNEHCCCASLKWNSATKWEWKAKNRERMLSVVYPSWRHNTHRNINNSQCRVHRADTSREIEKVRATRNSGETGFKCKGIRCCCCWSFFSV